MRWRHEDACSSRHGKTTRLRCSGGGENGRFPPIATCAVVVRNDPFTSTPACRWSIEPGPLRALTSCGVSPNIRSCLFFPQPDVNRVAQETIASP